MLCVCSRSPSTLSLRTKRAGFCEACLQPIQCESEAEAAVAKGSAGPRNEQRINKNLGRLLLQLLLQWRQQLRPPAATTIVRPLLRMRRLLQVLLLLLLLQVLLLQVLLLLLLQVMLL